MRESIVTGLPLPENAQEAETNSAPLFRRCISCDEPFSASNTHSAAGWRETQISGMCEDCFDELFKED